MRLADSLAGLLCLLALASCAESADGEVKRSAYIFSSRLDLTVLHENPQAAEAAISEAFVELQRLERDYHTWKEGKLKHLNNAIATGALPYPLDDDLAGLIRISSRMSDASNGLFNPALGKLFAMWGFHSDNPQARTASLDRINSFLLDAPTMGSISMSEGSLVSAHPETQLDFGAIMKGYGLDIAREILARKEVKNALLDFGSTILAMGQPEPGRYWTIAVRQSRKDPILGTAELRPGEALSASGSAESQYTDEDGSVVSHLFNPRTGRSAAQVRFAAVICGPACGKQAASVADSLSTAMVIASPEESREIADGAKVVDYALVLSGAAKVIAGSGLDPARLDGLRESD